MFLQPKMRNEPNLLNGKSIYFIKIFNSNMTFPLLYLGSIIIDSKLKNSDLYQAVSKEFDINKSNIIKGYMETSSTIIELSSIAEIPQSGSFIILELSKPLDPDIAFSLNYEAGNSFDPSLYLTDFIETVLYSDIMYNSIPDTIIEYLTQYNSQILCDVFMFNDQNNFKKPRIQVKIPTNITIQNLIDFLNIALDMADETKHHNVVIFTGDIAPIGAPLDNTAISELDSKGSTQKPKLYYYHSPNKKPKLAVPLLISQNRFDVSIISSLFIEKTEYIEYIYNFCQDNFQIDRKNLKVIQFDDDFQPSLPLERDLIKKDSYYRVDIINDKDMKQKENRKDKQVFLMTADLDETYTIHPYGFPFVFTLYEKETTLEMRARLVEIIGKPAAHARFFFASGKKLISRDFLKNDDIPYDNSMKYFYAVLDYQVSEDAKLTID